MTTSPLVLALDIGSSSTRAQLHDATGAPIPGAEARCSYALTTADSGAAELNPRALLEAVCTTIDELLAQAQLPPDTIAAVGCATLVGNLLALDKAGQPLTQLWSWADSRCAPAVRELRARWDGATLWQRTGCPIHSAYWPARLAFIATNEPALFRQARFVTFGEYLTAELTGRPLLSRSVLAWNGMLSRSTGDWDAKLLQDLGLSSVQITPLFTEPAAAAPRLTDTSAQRWPALRSAAWLPPIGDGLASNLGCGGVDDQTVVINMGTSAAVRAVLPSGRTLPAGLWGYCWDAERELVGGALSNGGNVARWIADTLKVPELDALTQALAARPPAGHGLVALPYLAGERSPRYPDAASGLLYGLQLHTEPLDIAQAMIEAVAYAIGDLYARLRPALDPEHRIIGGGGALDAAPWWAQLICDVIGQPLAEVGSAEATAQGAALYALRSIGALEAYPAPSIAASYKPNPERHRRYAAARARAQSLELQLIAAGEFGDAL